MTRIVLALLAALLALPAAVQAAPLGSTLLQSRTTGLDPFPSGGANASAMHRWSMSADGCRVVFETDGDGLVPDDNDRVRNVVVRDACEAKTILASRATGATGAAANAASSFASISPNGRYVAFMSSATNLAAQSGNGLVYRRDLQENTTVLISRRTSGPAAVGPLQGEAPTVANDGKVAFGSNGILDPADTNGVTGDIYVGDGTTTTLVSRNEAGSVGSQMQAISHDGSAIAFVTQTSLDPADTNTGFDLYVRKNGVNTLMSRANGAAGSATGGAQRPVINADGSVVGWLTSEAIDAKDTNTTTDVYRRKGDVTTLVTRKDGADSAGAAGGSTMPSMDSTGDRIAFLYAANDLTSEPAVSGTDVYLRDVAAGRTFLMSRKGTEGPRLGGTGSSVALAAGGTHIAFPSESDAVFAGDANDFTQIVRRRLSDGAVDQVSRPDGSGEFDGGRVNASSGGRDVVSRDGRYVAFVSGSDVLRDTSGRNAFVRDNKTGTTTQVNLTDADEPLVGGVEEVAISDDGRRVAFLTRERLDPDHDPSTGSLDVYVRDLRDGTTYLASRATGANTSATGHPGSQIAISGDGNRVAFATAAKLDTTLDLNADQDVYVRDLTTHATILASRGDGNAVAGYAPSLDRDGSRVAFDTVAKLDEDDAAGTDVYVRDLAAGVTHLVSRVDGDGSGAGNHSSNASLSADGSRVAFQTMAQHNMGSGSTNGHQHVFVRDIAQSTTFFASRTQDGAAGVGTSAAASLSADGRRVAFDTYAINLGHGPSVQRVVLKDLVTGAVETVSAEDGAGGASTTRDAKVPAMSADGRCVAFTTAGALTPAVQPAGDFEQVYLRAVSGDCPDETAPDTTITEAPDVRVATIDNEFAFTSSEPGERFECRHDDSDWYECSQNTQWDSASEGAHAFRVRAIDESGNVDPTPAKADFFVDLTTPETAIDSGPSGTIRQTSVEVTFSGSDDAFFHCRLDGEPWEDCDPPSKTLEALTEGEHTFEVRAFDYVGHVDETPAVVTFTVDTVGPAVTVGSVDANDDGVMKAAFSGADVASYRCAVDSTDLQPCTSPLTRSGLAAGEHTLRVQGFDAVGNGGPVVERRFTVPAKPVVVKEEPKSEPKPAAGGATTASGAAGTGAAGTGASGAPAAGGTPAPRSAPPAGTPARVLKTTVKRGAALVTLSCPATAQDGCKGVLVLSAKRLGVVGRRSYAVKAGRRMTLKLRLEGKAKKAKRVTARVA